jgi:hypothetical protein
MNRAIERREMVGFDRKKPHLILARLASHAIGILSVLKFGVKAIRQQSVG